MTVFASKQAFMELGFERLKPSAEHTHKDCAICLKPLDLLADHGHLQQTSHGNHPAVRINACGHMHGEECLTEWLKLGHTCPTCKRILFEPNTERITRQDVNDLVREFGQLFGGRRVLDSINRVAQKREKEYNDTVRKYIDREIARQHEKDAYRRDEFALSAEDFMDSDGDLFDSDAGTEHEEDSEDEDDVEEENGDKDDFEEENGDKDGEHAKGSDETKNDEDTV
jgi:hypothetical protein